MFLACCSNYQLPKLDLLFKSFNVTYEYIDLYTIEFDQVIIAKLEKEIKQYNYVLVSSELLAQKLLPVFVKNNIKTYIAAGYATAKYLLKNNIANVLYPEHESGIEAIIHQIMPTIQEQVMYLTCYKSEYKIPLNMAIQFDIYPVYKHIENNIDNEMVKNLLLSKDLKGIIITSKKYVMRLFNLATSLGVLDRLLNQQFIVIHKNIKDELIMLNVKKIQLSHGIEQMVDIIGKYYD